MAKNVKISTTFTLDPESIQIDELSLPNEATFYQRKSSNSSIPTPSPSKLVSIPKVPINDENKILKTIKSSKIPTLKKSLVMTSKNDNINSLRSRIGPSNKSTLPIAKSPFKPLAQAKPNILAPTRVALKSIENMDSTITSSSNKNVLITSTPTITFTNNSRKKISCGNYDKKKIRYSLSSIELTRINPDGNDEDSCDTKCSVIKD
ncbi:unnamed protein product [Diamesa serratosioi]